MVFCTWKRITWDTAQKFFNNLAGGSLSFLEKLKCSSLLSILFRVGAAALHESN